MTKLPIRTMVVDDDHLMRCLLADLLVSAGFEVRTAESCKQALTLFDEFTPDLIVCDWELPDAAGIELVRHIRYVQKDRNPFILMLTGHDSSVAQEQALGAGANDYLTKPIKKEELLARAGKAPCVQYLAQQLQILDQQGHLTVSLGYYSLYAS
ncbi:response regulator [Blastopirellula sp. JC732]|uniref:Response regulator n=1 Tax=Blastopirellula sediminis TaxID=2894196 RepID=A0A9X1SFV4_9BACT|nr:response regulator [Blastopirellula sediminis]MCC9609282.1 response regulator [Blastopirellula sediminis]MCC9627941.1 response regulator [Blastopirellula sediminis]